MRMLQASRMEGVQHAKTALVIEEPPECYSKAQALTILTGSLHVSGGTTSRKIRKGMHGLYSRGRASHSELRARRREE